MSDFKPETRALLDLGRDADDPTDHAIERNRRSLAIKVGVAALGTGALAGSTSKAAAASVGSWTSAKLLALCGSVIVGSALAFGTVRALRTEVPATASSVAEPRGSLARASAQPEANKLSEEPVPQPAPAVDVPLQPLSSSRTATAARPTPTRSIQDEFELVRAAQRHLHRNEPQAALAVLADHARRFPAGALAEEREASRVFALCGMGNVSAARAQAERFIKRSPKSPFVERVRASCRASSTPASP